MKGQPGIGLTAFLSDFCQTILKGITRRIGMHLQLLSYDCFCIVSEERDCFIGPLYSGLARQSFEIHPLKHEDLHFILLQANIGQDG